VPKKSRDWVHEPLVACVDGPMVNQWFTQKDWDARLDAARYMIARGGRRSPALDYVADRARPAITNPEDHAASGTVLCYRPGRKS